MAKGKSGSTSTGPTKAGKKHQYKAPAPVNEAKRDARLLGEKQFNLKYQPTVEVADRTGKVRAVPVPYTWDASRKRICFAPAKGDQR